MTSLESSSRYQDAVLWTFSGRDEMGEPILSEPEEICVRWQTKRTEMKDAMGNKVVVDALVHVNQEILIGSQMWLGELSYWLGTGSAGHDDEVMTVVVFHKAGDVKGRCYRRVVGLRKFKDTPGEVE